MSYSPFLPLGQWPVAFLQNTLFQYFVHNKYRANFEEYVHLNERKHFLDALNSNTNFSEFWTIIQEQYPEKKDYFLSLTNEEEPYDWQWIRWEFDAYLEKQAFEAFSEEDRKGLEDEFKKLRPAAYKVALRGEALRLNCDISEVRQVCHVLLQIRDNDEESLLVKLPNDIFERILTKLDTVEIFRMTLVSRKWKSLICKNAKQLTRAEHAVTTHIITFTDWMDPPSTFTTHFANHLNCIVETPTCATFLRQYQLFNWSLMRWYCGISTNLETLIVDHPTTYTDLATLLQSCPKLKHLRIANDNVPDSQRDVTNPATVHLRELKVFLYSYSYSVFSYGSYTLPRHLHRDVLVFSDNLQVFRGSLNQEDLLVIDVRRPVSNVFSKLIALDLKTFTPSALEMLAHNENLQWRYLKLGHHCFNNQADGFYDEERTRSALHQLLPKLKQLEILITSITVGIMNETIQLLTDLEVNLSFAVLYHAYFPDENDDGELDFSIEIDPLKPGVLEAFQNMLTINNPAINLTEIRFVLVEGEILDSLEAVDTGFTFLRLFDDNCEPKSYTELTDPQMQRRLGIES